MPLIWLVVGELTVEVEINGGVALSQLVLGRDFVFTSVTDGHVAYVQAGSVRVAILVDWYLNDCSSKVSHPSLFGACSSSTIGSCLGHETHEPLCSPTASLQCSPRSVPLRVWTIFRHSWRPSRDAFLLHQRPQIAAWLILQHANVRRDYSSLAGLNGRQSRHLDLTIRSAVINESPYPAGWLNNVGPPHSFPLPLATY